MHDDDDDDNDDDDDDANLYGRNVSDYTGTTLDELVPSGLRKQTLY